MIKVSLFTSFVSDSEKDADQPAFINSALNMKKAPVSIIDLRGNYGGSSNTGIQWIKNYIGESNLSDYSFKREGNLLLVSTPVQKIFNDVGITDFSKKTQSSFLVFSKGQKAPFLAKWCLLKIIVLL